MGSTDPTNGNPADLETTMSIFGALPLWCGDPYADALEAEGYIRNIGQGILRKKLPAEPQARGIIPMHAGHPRAGKRNKAFFNRDMEA